MSTTAVSQLVMPIFDYFTTFMFFIEFPIKKIYFKDNKLIKILKFKVVKIKKIESKIKFYYFPLFFIEKMQTILKNLPFIKL